MIKRYPFPFLISYFISIGFRNNGFSYGHKNTKFFCTVYSPSNGYYKENINHHLFKCIREPGKYSCHTCM